MEIRYNDKISEKGLYSTKFYPKDSIVFVLKGEIYNHPTRETIHIGNNKHIYDKYGIFMNHSFTPNVKIVGKNVFALCDVNVDDEIVFNYNESEINMHSPFCVNGRIVCGKTDF